MVIAASSDSGIAGTPAAGARSDARGGAAAGRVDAAWQALEGVLDPEVPVLSVLDLGLVRGITETDDGVLEVALTPTYSGCPAVEVIEAAVHGALLPLGPVRVRRQLAPAWTSDWISQAGREKLRAYGIAPPGPASAASTAPSDGAATAVVRVIPRSGAMRERVPCPRCGSTRTERLSAFGATACKALWRCLDCREPFEHFKPL